MTGFLSNMASGQVNGAILKTLWVKDESGCWFWIGCINRTTGYGKKTWYGRSMMAHRWMYEQYNGPIPEGMHIHHICRVRHCVNPDHLEAVTRFENMQRAWDNHGKEVTNTPSTPKRKGKNWGKKWREDESGCWLWTGCIHYRNGYGKKGWHGKVMLAHRWMYEQRKGPIPEGMQIHHTCGVRHCVNPDHLEAVTPAKNMREAWDRTHQSAKFKR